MRIFGGRVLWIATVVALGKGEEFIQMRIWLRQRLWVIYRS